MARVVEYVYRESPVHNLHPLSKLAWALGMMVLAFTFQDARYLLAVFLTTVAVAAAGKVLKDLTFVIKDLTLFAGILLLLQVLIGRDGQVLFTPGQNIAVYPGGPVLGSGHGAEDDDGGFQFYGVFSHHLV